MDTMVESGAPSAKKTAEEEMADEAESFAKYTRDWESAWRKTCGSFDNTTVLSSTQFTCYTPGRIPYNAAGTTPETLQVISIRLAQVAGGLLEFPLSVYGVVAARDTVDRNRNTLFHRHEHEAQRLTQNDPFLRLTGPSRAIVFTDAVDFEIQLRVKGAPNKALISCARRSYNTGGYSPSGASTTCFKNVLCTVELCSQPVRRTVQATILGVQVVKRDGPWPFQHGGMVACYSHSGELVLAGGRGVVSRAITRSSSQIVLLETEGRGAIRKDCDGYLRLQREVVSVEIEGALDVVLRAYSKSGDVAKRARVRLSPKFYGISEEKCAIGGAQVTITVAWSLVPTDVTEIGLEVGSSRRVV